MKQATKMVLGAAAIVAVSAGVAGVTTYSMLKPEPNKSVAFNDVFQQNPNTRLAALDALLGAARAYFQRSFSDKVFVISFFSNVITATLLVFLGNQLGVGSQLQTAVIVVLGIRIFTNVSSIRRFIFKG